MALLPLALNRLSPLKQRSLFGLTVGLWAFIAYNQWFASREAQRFLGAVQLDKVVHIAGGVFIAMLFEWLAPRRRLGPLLIIFAAATTGWEVFEYLFDAETIFFRNLNPDLWALDSFGDIIAAFLGGYGYWVFGMTRGQTDLTDRIG